MRYGYIRVSTKEQNVDRQLTAMYEEGISTKQLYIDKISGKDFNRSAYKRMVKRLKKGDEIVIKSIDRLGRNYDEILEQWRYLVREREVDIRVIDLELLNTKSLDNNVTGRFISDLVLQVLSYVAQVERENMLQRQKEGIREAKKKGVRFGRPKKEIPSNFEEVFQQWELHELNVREAARILGVAKTTCYNWLVVRKNQKKCTKY
ncbi:recombinase family protein [Aerococcaceae bacterium zg-ZUI334]|uniref:recombinase family protein n=1 Tax=Aerococcaceae TaxID=186827 RepID=UPI0013D75D6F|nr:MULTISPECIES: recombinase family protein [unclassified Facklamia]MBR7928352.1 recombinase family protein [Aerococcaceae bacterium zg-ZUI334]MBS4461087.1 recombinase family protein [Aerococcaceae bacterium zg-B36]QQD64882.1 recombinase family protein [Aerococcaceae bacterium zg-252]